MKAKFTTLVAKAERTGEEQTRMLNHRIKLHIAFDVIARFYLTDKLDEEGAPHGITYKDACYMYENRGKLAI